AGCAEPAVRAPLPAAVLRPEPSAARPVRAPHTGVRPGRVTFPAARRSYPVGHDVRPRDDTTSVLRHDAQSPTAALAFGASRNDAAPPPDQEDLRDHYPHRDASARGPRPRPEQGLRQR